ncbi:MAG: SGNH/GDSL hydrolase family protein [Pirellulales bacterium]|nr:SGNH/GDSL hydrolase family protein [Pirellulales bacterium]
MIENAPPALAEPRPRLARSWRRLVVLRVMSVAAGLLAAWVLLEAGMRLFDFPAAPTVAKRILLKKDAPQKLRYDCYPTNPHGEFQPLPDTSQATWSLFTSTLPPTELSLDRLSETPWCVEYSSYDLTLRAPDFARQPLSGVRRIAVFGDSFVYGEGVPIESTLTRQAETLLGTGYELLNLGGSGWNTRQERAALEQYVPLLQASRAIVVFTANDVEPTPELAARQSFLNDLVNLRDDPTRSSEARSWFSVPSRLVQFVDRTIDMRRIRNETIQWYQDLYDPLYNQPNLEKLADDLRHMRSRTDCQVVLVLYPLLEGFEGAYPLAEVHRKVAAMAESVGLPVLDLAPAFAGQTTAALWVHESDHHPNRQGHAIAARALVDWLTTLPGFLDGPPSSDSPEGQDDAGT